MPSSPLPVRFAAMSFAATSAVAVAFAGLFSADVARADGPHADGSRAEGERWATFGVGLAASDVDGRIGADRASFAGGGLDLFLLGLRWLRPHLVLSGEMRAFMELGSGSGGFTAAGFGRLDYALAYVVPVAPEQGPLVGLGVRVETFLDPLWGSAEIPRFELGYLWQRHDWLVRAVAYGSFLAGGGTLDGSTHGTTLRPDVGGRVLVGVAAAGDTYVAIDARHLLEAGGNPGLPVDQLTGDACLAFSRAVAACAEVALFRGPTYAFDPHVAQWRVWSIDLALLGAKKSVLSHP